LNARKKCTVYSHLINESTGLRRDASSLQAFRQQQTHNGAKLKQQRLETKCSAATPHGQVDWNFVICGVAVWGIDQPRTMACQEAAPATS
jgi:hypothetical protein